jgi:ABC-type transporter Mla MlaB component
MHLNREQAGVSGGGRARPRGKRGAVSRQSRAPLRLARLQPAREQLVSGAVATLSTSSQQLPVARQLLVRWERGPDLSILWLSGALDRATATLLDRELHARASVTTRLLVDLTGLEFIDAHGVDSLVRAHQPACEHGFRLSFRRGPHLARSPLGLIRIVRLRSEWATRPTNVSAEDSYFALAMACADFDHPRPGDRPGAA